ncbi:MAG: hypothetical protein QM534_15610 [Sediminibacterium sp.]|nr:hypothetical protein [Sediminibacterium sp.]
MKNSFRYLLLLLFVVPFLKVAKAQDIKVSAILDSSKIRIGEQVKLDLYVTYNANAVKNFQLQWPEIVDTIVGKVEVIETSPIDTMIPDKNQPAIIQQHQRFIISAYDSGYFAMPPFRFVLNGDTAHPLLTEALLLEVHTVATDSSEAKVKDIKPLFEEPFNWKWYIHYVYYGLAALAIIATIIVLTVYFTRKSKTVVKEPEKPKVPAHITALASLEKVKTEKVWKEDKIKEYYSQISDTIRLYIEERFGVFALESTTDEIMLAFRTQVVDPVSKEKLQQLLQLSDLVKFAKMSPIEAEHEFTLQNAFDFVNGTKREEEYSVAPENNTADTTNPINTNTP